MNGVLVANAAFNSLKKDSAKYNTETNRKRTNVKDRSATDSVLDAATRMSLFKMLNSGMLDELNGVVSCGKEAHVYHCVGGDFKCVPSLPRARLGLLWRPNRRATTNTHTHTPITGMWRVSTRARSTW